MTCATELCAQLHRLVVPDIIRVKEHEPNSSSALVNLEGVSSQNNPLGDNSSGVSIHECTSSDQDRGVDIGAILGENNWQAAELNGGIDGDDGAASVLEEALALVDIVGSLAVARVLRENGIDNKATESAVEDQGGLGLDDTIILCVAVDDKVDDSHLVLVLQKSKDNEGTRSRVGI